MPNTIKERFWRKPTGFDVLVFVIALCLMFFISLKLPLGEAKHLQITVKSSEDCTITMSYIPQDASEYLDGNVAECKAKRSDKYRTCTIKLPRNTMVKTFSIRPAMAVGVQGTVEIRKIALEGTFFESRLWRLKDIPTAFELTATDPGENGKSYLMKIGGNGPAPELRLKAKDLTKANLSLRVLMIACVSFITALFIVFMVRTSSARHLSGQRVRDVALTGVFILFISSHILNSFLKIVENEATTEKRSMAVSPAFTINGIFDYPARFDAYLNDNFSLRSALLRLNHYIKLVMLKTSPVPRKVMLGDDGWLFYADNFEVDDYSLNNPVSKKDLEKIYVNLTYHRKWLDTLGIKYYVLIAPNKNTVYPEQMPSFVHRAEHTGLDQIIERLAPEFQVIDLRQVLSGHKKDPGLLYYKTDTHWNTKGAFLAYQALMETIKKDYPDLRVLGPVDMQDVQTDYQGDLISMLGIDAWPMESVIENKIIKQSFKRMENINFNVSNISAVAFPGVIVDVCEDCSPVKALVFRDSFATILRPYLSQTFGQTEYIWSNNFNSDLVAERKPDIVIEVLVERSAKSRLVLPDNWKPDEE